MNLEITPSVKKATCITEGTYSNTLTYSKIYEIIASNEQKHQIKVRGDTGRIRWYPCGCFDMTEKIMPKLTNIVRHDPIEKHLDWIEVEIELSNDQHRWCYFITPEMLSQQQGGITFGSGRLLSYHVPHMIVVSTISQEMIEQTLKYIESQGALLDCTKLISSSED